MSNLPGLHELSHLAIETPIPKQIPGRNKDGSFWARRTGENEYLGSGNHFGNFGWAFFVDVSVLC